MIYVTKPETIHKYDIEVSKAPRRMKVNVKTFEISRKNPIHKIKEKPPMEMQKVSRILRV